jgi:hypothetical protein
VPPRTRRQTAARPRPRMSVAASMAASNLAELICQGLTR